ncbi:minor tail protein [Arthrobacter phage Shambre1]|uniref:Minor tail protein n=1 Tax=Arthrobacter phage Shambre1 TaxID=2927284 RepID=A0A977KNK3_9CAUD|nr:minor tail protein [Arthrobacter phage Shambre1]UXE04755.1 minor tail protein [Arthrobacter phage Shambre1]
MTALTSTSPLELTIRVGDTSEILGINMEITQEGLPGWYGGGVGVRRTDSDKIGKHGIYSEPGTRGGRLVSVQGAYWADSVNEAAAVVDDLNALLAEGTEGRLTVIDEPFGTRWADCYLTGTPDVEWDGTESGTFAFDVICPDPRKYGDVFSRNAAPAADAGAMRTQPLFGGPVRGILAYGPGGDTGTLTIRNTGTAEISPFIRVDGDSPGFTVTEIETQRRIVYNEGVPAGHWLEINTTTGTVMLDGIAPRNLVVAQWPLVPGRSARTYMFESAGTTPMLTMTAAPAWW